MVNVSDLWAAVMLSACLHLFVCTHSKHGGSAHNEQPSSPHASSWCSAFGRLQEGNHLYYSWQDAEYWEFLIGTKTGSARGGDRHCEVLKYWNQIVEVFSYVTYEQRQQDLIPGSLSGWRRVACGSPSACRRVVLRWPWWTKYSRSLL